MVKRCGHGARRGNGGPVTCQTGPFLVDLRDRQRQPERPSPWGGISRVRSAARIKPKSSDADRAPMGCPSGAPNTQNRARVRRLRRVQLHIDLTMLARLAEAAIRANAGRLAA